MIYSASLIKLIIKLKVKIKEQKGRNFMQRATAEKKDLLNLSETIEYFNLSQRKFHSLIREKTVHDFIVFYGSRRLIIRTAFERYILNIRNLGGADNGDQRKNKTRFKT